MKNRAALFDIDKTLYDGHVVIDFPKHLLSRGITESKFVETQRSILEEYNAAQISYESMAQKLLVEFSSSLAGQSYEFIKDEASRFLQANGIMKWQSLFKLLKQQGFDTYIVSGEPEFIGEVYVELLDLTDHITSSFETSNKYFTGKYTNLLYDSVTKTAALERIISEQDLSISFAVGDSTVDLGMLKLAKYPICVEPSKELNEIAEKNGWTVVRRDELKETINGLV